MYCTTAKPEAGALLLQSARLVEAMRWCTSGESGAQLSFRSWSCLVPPNLGGSRQIGAKICFGGLQAPCVCVNVPPVNADSTEPAVHACIQHVPNTATRSVCNFVVAADLGGSMHAKTCLCVALAVPRSSQRSRASSVDCQVRAI
eukprot:scaffold243002_cov13-Tisochrysis_lutea.AAC.1